MWGRDQYLAPRSAVLDGLTASLRAHGSPLERKLGKKQRGKQAAQTPSHHESKQSDASRAPFCLLFIFIHPLKGEKWTVSGCFEKVTLWGWRRKEKNVTKVTRWMKMRCNCQERWSAGTHMVLHALFGLEDTLLSFYKSYMNNNNS